jgi:hypothetical protein
MSTFHGRAHTETTTDNSAAPRTGEVAEGSVVVQTPAGLVRVPVRESNPAWAGAGSAPPPTDVFAAFAAVPRKPISQPVSEALANVAPAREELTYQRQRPR